MLIDSPRVASHRRHVNTIVGDTAELQCSYNTSTAGHITWRKNGNDVPTNDVSKFALHTEQRHSAGHFRSTLKVKNVQHEDLGEYSCDVHNIIGKAQTKVQLVLTPETPNFTKADIDSDVVVTHWTIRSHQALSEVKLNYKQNGVCIR